MIYLASRSPRRRELLSQIGIDHLLVDVEVDETPHDGEAAADYVLRLACDKANAGFAGLGSRADRPVLAADTSVVLDGRILGKPADLAEFRAMMQALSGNSHEVLTGVCLHTAGHSEAERVHARLSRSTVEFRPLGQDEIDAYWATGEPRDKAGGYGIQGLAAVFIRQLRGSYSGVMGLPLFETAELLRECGIQPLQMASRAK